MISWSRAAIVPNECHNKGARSGTISRFLLMINYIKTWLNKKYKNADLYVEPETEMAVHFYFPNKEQVLQSCKKSK